LFRGAVTARRIEATGGNGRVVGLKVDGAIVPLKAGTTVAVEGWGLLTRGASLGRLRAPLMLRLVRMHDSLPAGTRIAVAFAASSRPPSETGRASAKKQSRHVRPPDFPATSYPFTPHGDFGPALRANPVIAIASRYLGIRYQWGGSEPSTGFDCSGLVKYVFAQLDVPMVHFAAAQWHSPDTVWVPPHRLAPGDLVFFVGSDGTREEPGHVGIYVRDGYFIDAPHTGAVVRVDRLTDPIFARQYIGARRVVVPLHELDAGTTLRTDAIASFSLPQILLGSLGESPTVVAAGPTARDPNARANIATLGIPVGSFFLILGGAAAFIVRRKRRPADIT
jgi:cell wall-associated NlpC family hydrolase